MTQPSSTETPCENCGHPHRGKAVCLWIVVTRGPDVAVRCFCDVTQPSMTRKKSESPVETPGTRGLG